MHFFVFIALFISSLTASAAQVLDLGTYYLSVKQRGISIVYTHDVYDSNHVPRFALMKMVMPVKRDGRHEEDYSYAFGVKEDSGNVIWTALDENIYKNLRAKIEKAKQETAVQAWTHGCRIRAVISDRHELVGFFSLCDDSPGTIEADSNR
jgi:hypothetical protein